MLCGCDTWRRDRNARGGGAKGRCRWIHENRLQKEKKPHENAYILAGKRQEARALVSGKKGEKAVVYGHGGSEKSREDLI